MSTQIKWELGKVYRVSFSDGKSMDVVPIGGEPVRFNVVNHEKETLTGFDWLKDAIKIEEIGDTVVT